MSPTLTVGVVVLLSSEAACLWTPRRLNIEGPRYVEEK